MDPPRTPHHQGRPRQPPRHPHLHKQKISVTLSTDHHAKNKERHSIMKRCPHTNCPNLIPNTARYCATHLTEWEQGRGTNRERGYGSRHRAVRARYLEGLRRGKLYRCARCGGVIVASRDERGRLVVPEFHLDHEDGSREVYVGISHPRCNVVAAGRARARFAAGFQPSCDCGA